jgi:FtsZ-binding cell division protein ZapB
MSQKAADLEKQLTEARETIQRLNKELEEIKAQLRRHSEEACVKELTEVLTKHNCNLKAEPDGKFKVVMRD